MYGEIVSCFKRSNEDNLLELLKTQADFNRENNGNEIGYKLFVFDVRYQQDYSTPHQNKERFNFSRIIV